MTMGGRAGQAWTSFRPVLRQVWRHRLGRSGVVVLVVVAAAAVLAPLVAPYNPATIHYDGVLAPPGARFWLGSDEIGRDVLSRIIFGARISLQIVAVAIVSASIIGSLVGLLSGFLGGWRDSVIMRVMDALIAFPTLILALGIIAVLGPSTVNAMLAIGIVNIPGFARLVRAETLRIRELDFVTAGRALGASPARLMIRHVLPNVLGTIIVYASLRASTALLTESSLSFLGLGAQPPTPSWGYMLAVGMGYGTSWWLSIFPGLAIFFTVLAMNFFGDALRDVLDPRLKGQGNLGGA